MMQSAEAQLVFHFAPQAAGVSSSSCPAPYQQICIFSHFKTRCQFNQQCSGSQICCPDACGKRCRSPAQRVLRPRDLCLRALSAMSPVRGAGGGGCCTCSKYVKKKPQQFSNVICLLKSSVQSNYIQKKLVSLQYIKKYQHFFKIAVFLKLYGMSHTKHICLLPKRCLLSCMVWSQPNTFVYYQTVVC